jgi:hypothetical protein
VAPRFAHALRADHATSSVTVQAAGDISKVIHFGVLRRMCLQST